MTDASLVRKDSTRPGQVIAWSMWDWGSAAFNAVIVTFVFSVYLVNGVGADYEGRFSPANLLAWSTAAAGLFIAVLAPVLGQSSDARGKRKRSLFLLTSAVVVTTLLMFFVKDDPAYLWLGLLLLGVGAVLFELAEVPYFAMLRQVSTPDTVGRVSGTGWAFGYLGGIVLLLICFFGFIAGDGPARGFFQVTTEDGLNVRLVAVLAAVWFAVFALPLFRSVPEIPADPARATTTSFFGAYAALWRDVKDLWARDRRTLYFLIVSAVYRDGLAGVFAFGAIIAVSVYGINEADVILFGIAANVVAAAGAFAAGALDDRFGPKIVIVVSLVSMIVAGSTLFFLDGPASFWVFGLVLCAFVGPAQSASRTFLTRITPPGREGQNFGFYQMTGRASSFLTPAFIGLFIAIGGDDRHGMLGILLVLAAGLSAFAFIRAPQRDRASGG